MATPAGNTSQTDSCATPTLGDALYDITALAPPVVLPIITYDVLVEQIFFGDDGKNTETGELVRPVRAPASPELIPKLLSALHEVILNDEKVGIDFGWELLSIAYRLPGSEHLLITLARLGNPRELMLGVEEAWEMGFAEDEQKFCVQLKLLSIIYPRLRVPHPSRFLAASWIAILENYQPSFPTTLAVVDFIHNASGKKRPSLPGRKSSIAIDTTKYTAESSKPVAPDPEAGRTDPDDAALCTRLLQGMVSWLIEQFINSNPMEWAIRLQEFYDPTRVVAGRASMNEAFREDPMLQMRVTINGQLIALARDIGLADYDVLFDTIFQPMPVISDADPRENLPKSPEDVPLSQTGCLYLATSLMFSSVILQTKGIPPKIFMFPEHAKLLEKFFEDEEQGTVDALLAIGLFLENTNSFVSGKFEDKDFLKHLRALSLWSANNPSPGLRYCAHMLTTSVLHAHPVDVTRFSFISKTLQDPAPEALNPEALRASAITWLKEEIVMAHEREMDNFFSSEKIFSSIKEYIFPNIESLNELSGQALEDGLMAKFPVHMAALNLLYLVSGEQYDRFKKSNFLADVAKDYLTPLRMAQERAASSSERVNEEEKGSEAPNMELELLGEQIAICWAHIHD